MSTKKLTEPEIGVSPVVEKEVSGHLLAVDAPRIVADTDSATIKGYYVIIGRGPAAWYNHLTLLGTAGQENAWGTKRIAGLPVMHIGLKESWSRREHERMGQWPRMLNLFAEIDDTLSLPPEYLADDNPNARDWLPANVFARGLEVAEDYVQEWYNLKFPGDSAKGEYDPTKRFIVKNGFAGVIEQRSDFDDEGNPKGSYMETNLPKLERDRRGKADLDMRQPGLGRELVFVPEGASEEDYKKRWLASNIPYRIPVYRRRRGEPKAKLEFVYAYKVDVCSSYGTPRTFEAGSFTTKPLFDAHMPNRDVLARDEMERCPQIVDGNEFIGVPADPEKTVIVFKGNPVGAQSVQSALDMPKLEKTFKKVYYVSNADIIDNDAGVPGGRNLLEMVGDADDEELARFKQSSFTSKFATAKLFDDLPENHGWDWLSRGRRIKRFNNRLLRASFYEIDKISLTADSRVNCKFTLKGRTGSISKSVINNADEDYAHFYAFTMDNRDVRFDKVQFYWRWERYSLVVKDGRGDLDANRMGASFIYGGKDKYFAYADSWVLEGDTPLRAKVPRAEPAYPEPTAAISDPIKTLDVQIVCALLKEITADLLVYALGQQNDKSVEGCAAYLTQLVGKMAPLKNTALSLFNNGVTGGLEDPEAPVEGGVTAAKRIRILGAAAATGANCLPDVNYTTNHSQHHAATLCQEMPAGGGGLNINLPCIRRANQFKGLRVKINSASEEELRAAGLSEAAAKWIVKKRALTDRGYTVAEYKDMLTGNPLKGVDIKKVGVRYPNPDKPAALLCADEPMTADAEKLTPDKFEF